MLTANIHPINKLAPIKTKEFELLFGALLHIRVLQLHASISP
jgi:hypothetical protein